MTGGFYCTMDLAEGADMYEVYDKLTLYFWLMG